MLILLLLACHPEISPELQDRNLYLAASSTRDGEQAVQVCQQIQHANLQGECLVFAAKTLVRQRRDGLKACALAPSKAWRQACYFDVADTAGFTGEQAARLCAQSGDFRRRCLYHALQREEGRFMQAFPKGQELQLQQAIRKRAEQLQIDESEEERIDKSLLARIIAKRYLQLYRKDKKQRFSTRHCGAAAADICTEAYRFVVKQTTGWQAGCAAQPEVEPLTQKGIPVWEPDFADAARQAWKNVCEKRRGRQQKSPDQHGIGK